MIQEHLEARGIRIPYLKVALALCAAPPICASALPLHGLRGSPPSNWLRPDYLAALCRSDYDGVRQTPSQGISFLKLVQALDIKPPFSRESWKEVYTIEIVPELTRRS